MRTCEPQGLLELHAFHPPMRCSGGHWPCFSVLQEAWMCICTHVVHTHDSEAELVCARGATLAIPADRLC